MVGRGWWFGDCRGDVSGVGVGNEWKRGRGKWSSEGEKRIVFMK